MVSLFFWINMNYKLILFLLAFIQFNHIVDFMIIMPLGPILMKELSINTSQFATLVSIYTFSAGLMGFIGSFWVDRFDRKVILTICTFGFSIATFLCGTTSDFYLLLIFRAIAGIFGGLIGSQVLSTVSDLFPLDKRSSALGIIMASFSLASIAGVPLGLYLSNHLGWNIAFYAIGIMGFLSFIFCIFFIPPMNSHISKEKPSVVFLYKEIFRLKEPLKALLLMFCLMMGQFTVIPFIATYLVLNAKLADQKVFMVYLCGGLATFFTARIIGRFADRKGRKFAMTILGIISIIPLLLVTHIQEAPMFLILIVTTTFMIFVSGRMIPTMALISSTVPPKIRGGFMSLNSTVQMSTSGFASWIGGFILIETQSGLMGYNTLGYIATGFTLLSIVLIHFIKESE